MDAEFLTGLVQNAALLIALTTLYNLILRFRVRQSRLTPLVLGLLFGTVAIMGMRMPVRYAAGVFYDGRSIVLTLAGVFGGGATALVAGALAFIYRYLVGGPGVWAGVATIVSCSLLGWGFYRFYRHVPADLRLGELYLLGVVAHLVMLACQLLIQPWPRGVVVIRAIWLPIMLIFPLATVLMGVLLRTEDRRLLAEERLAQSEARYRLLFASASDALLLMEEGRFIEANARALELFGCAREHLIGAKPDAFSPPLQPDGRPSDEAAQARIAEALSAGDAFFSWQHRRADGTLFDAEVALSRIVLNGRALLLASVRDVTERNRVQALLQRLVSLYAMLSAFNHAVITSSSAEALFEITCHLLVEKGGLAGAWIGLLDEATQQVTPVVWAGQVAAYLAEAPVCLPLKSLLPEPTCQALNEDRAVFVQECLEQQAPWCALACAQGHHSMAAVPFRYAARKGVLVLYASPVGFFAPEEQDLMREIGQTLTFALDQIHAEAERQRMEQELRASEAAFRAMFEAHAVVKLLIDPDTGAIVDANEAAESFYGWTREQLRGMYIQQINTLPPEAIKHEMEKARRAQRIYFEFRHRRADGSIRDVAVFSSGVPYRGKTLLYSIIYDITAAKAAERTLQERERELSTLLANLPGMAYRCHNDPYWTMEFVSEGCLALTGYAPEDVIHNRRVSYADLIVPADRAAVWDAVQEALARDAPYELTYRIQTAQGEERWVWERGRGVRDDEGNIRFLEGFVLDITQQRLAEERRARLYAEVQQQATDIAHILNAVPEGILVLDAAHRVVRSNPLAERYLALLAPTYQTEPIVTLGDRRLEELLASPPGVGLWHEVKADERIFEVLSRSLAPDMDRTQRWLLVLRDVTEAREQQERLQHQERLATVGQLAAGIAHDFNNILAVIMLYADMGQRDASLSPALAEALATIKREGQRAAELIQQILDYGRRSILNRQAVNLVTFLQDSVRFLRRTLPETIAISLAVPDSPAMVYADPTRLNQMLVNLAINARDAMPKGGELRISLSTVAPDTPIRCHFCGILQGEPWLALTVSDTGTGIPPDVLPRIFEPFYTTKDVGKGTGLGLAQVYGIIELHHGHLDLQTAVGKGTSFTVYLPPLPQPEVETKPQATAESYDGAGRLILVVEDAPMLRRALADTLKAYHFRVVTAANGNEALSVLESYPEVALILSDMVMPGMDGQALLEALRARQGAPPLVMISGHPMGHEAERLRAQGLAGWLTKPVQLDDLLQLLMRLLTSQDGPA